MKKKFFSKLLMVALVATVGAFSSCKDYDDDIADVRNSLTQKATELQKDYNDKIAAVNTTLEKLQTSYDNLEAAYKKADEALKAQLETTIGDKLAEAKAYTDAAKGEALTAAQAAEAAAKTYAEQQAAAAQAAAIAAAKEQVAAAQKELSDKLAAANELIASQGKSIENLLKADQTLEAAIATAQARANEAYALADKANTLAETNKANLEKAASDIAALQTSLSALESKAADKADVAKLQSDLAALQKTVNENVVNLADYKENITKLTSDLAALKEDLAKQVSILGESIAAVKATAEGNVAKIESINTQLAKLQEANTQAHEQIIASVNSLAQTVEANKGEAATALAKAVEGIEAKLAATNKLIETNDAAIRALVDTKASELKALIDGNTAAIVKNAQDIQKNAEAQKAENTLMNNAIAKNAQDIVAQGKDITKLDDAVKALKAALGDDTAATLKAYAESIAKSEALQAKLDAQGYSDAQDAAQNLTIMEAIKQQAAQDKEAWESAIKIAIENLVTTYKLASLNEYIKQTAEAAQTAAEQNAAVKAQQIADKALQDAKAYTDVLAQTLKDNYTTSTDMKAAIETAKKAAISQAYLDVLNTLLRDYDEWYNMNDENKMNLELTPTIIQLTKAAVEKYGLTKENAQSIIDATIEAGLTKPEGTGTYDKDGNEIMTEPGVIMAEILAAADALQQEFTSKFDGIDLRLQPIEEFLGATLGEGEAFKASVNAIIATSATASDVEALKKQIAGTEASGLLTKINDAAAQAAQNAADVQKVMTTINNINGMFTSLFGGAEATSNVDEKALKTFEENIQALVERINGIKAITDNLDDKVMEAVNKNLGPQIQNMITSINLYANQHMAELDEQFKLAYWNGEEYEYPAGYDNFDHELTFVYTIEQGIFSDLKGTVKQAQWNYPEGLISQLKGLKNTRPAHYADDYDYDYEGVSFSALDGTDGYDFVDGRYRSYEDSILVRVSPTNADLSKAEIALINSKGEDIIADELVKVLDVKPYKRNAPITRFQAATRADEEVAAAKETGLWVIKFKLNDDQVGEKWSKYAVYEDKVNGVNYGQIVYAVAVKNTDFSTEETEDVDRYVVSEYDLSLATEAAKHANDFKANGVSVSKIHNRYIQAEQSENGTTSWTDDPIFNQGKFRYELTWKDLCDDDIPAKDEEGDDEVALKNVWYEYCWECCYFNDGGWNDECYEKKVDENGNVTYNRDKFVGRNEIGYTSILFDGATDGYEDNPYACGINTVDRYKHSFDRNSGVRNMNDGVDNRHKFEPLPISFTADQAPEGEDGNWAKIEIEFPSFNQCGERTPIRGFFVTMDQHFAIESDNSEMNAWPLYITKNIAKYPSGNGKTKTDEKAMLDMFEQSITLQEGNKGVIYLKDARNLNDGDVIGFRVHAVNLDGTFTDPDGRAFYVKVGNKSNHHELTFTVTATNYETGDSAVQDLVKGKNPIAQFNADCASEKSDRRFFERPAYGPSFENVDEFRVIYTWREGNPAIRGEKENSKNAYWPVAETGLKVENDYVGDYGKYTKLAVVKDKNGNIPDVTTYDYSVEKFFTFKFSKDNILSNADIDKAYWYEYDELDDEDPSVAKYGANVLTNSMLAIINPEVEDRLIDGETYKVTMTIQQLDSKTTWVTKNVIDIDIIKKMPTESGLTVKTGQTEVLKDGVWKFYVRPLVDADVEAATAQNANQNPTEGRPSPYEGVTDPWKITWNDFDTEFTTDKDKDGIELAQSQHVYRWAADTRPWTLDEMFNGPIETKVAEDGVTREVSKDFYFVFKGAGDFLAAEKAINATDPKEAKTPAEADKDNMAGDGTSVYNPNPATVSVAGDATHMAIGYSMPYVHYSNITTDSKNAKLFNVLAGRVFRRVSAKLDESGKAFIEPKAEDAGSQGFVTPILNRDFKLKATQIKTTDKKDLKAQYFCAMDYELAFPGTLGTTTECKYNQSKTIDIFGADAALTAGTMYEKFAPKGKSYVDTKFPTAWSTLPKLSQLVADKYFWVDYSSIEIVLPKDAPYTLSEYFDVYFAESQNDDLNKEIKPSDAKNNSKIKYLIVKPNRTGLFPALNKVYDQIQVKYNVYDVWHHGPQTITVKGIKILAPENQAARQAR